MMNAQVQVSEKRSDVSAKKVALQSKAFARNVGGENYGQRTEGF